MYNKLYLTGIRIKQKLRNLNRTNKKQLYWSLLARSETELTWHSLSNILSLCASIRYVSRSVWLVPTSRNIPERRPLGSNQWKGVSEHQLTGHCLEPYTLRSCWHLRIGNYDLNEWRPAALCKQRYSNSIFFECLFS